MTVIMMMPQVGASYGNSATGITMLLNRLKFLVAWKVFHKLKVGTLTPDMVTLYDVCENMIKPQTGDLKCSLVELYAGLHLVCIGYM